MESNDRAFELGYRAGLMSGWNCGITEDHARFNKIFEAHVPPPKALSQPAPSGASPECSFCKRGWACPIHGDYRDSGANLYDLRLEH